ncbi:2-C-methyl-D-erythritol 2,4-cyclodiphosphate synthase [Desulfocicer vacuolatum DSM 3385]|uniref:2-C-methyl-D-erythritol 2,4-cyclodiphosphate synthase n=1 Tax=Desulfocicer vacuolatum DSM 3385 TaxID=1121400 RepID=A0A1W2AI90_9BACT|nr:2-C-methyl-D-erythritol 2,4-cyclodiphosphate synthase [Desulfocicer vacuolatum]SMC60387.1 2-C-methyl-D-erythritol 2,4-cyclodiphosphate synthase [Desulfocicer vacuolatum DSM 3385]
MNFRIGSGYDVHQLVSDRKLILGGVTISHEKGLKGHSDADVIVHAVCDAMLGGAGLGDIGEHFPDSDPSFKGISSLVLMAHCRHLLQEKGYEVGNIDGTVFAQAPRISPYKKAMEENLARAAGVSVDRVNIKATTTEGLGFEGRGEGIGAHAVVLLQKLVQES